MYQEIIDLLTSLDKKAEINKDYPIKNIQHSIILENGELYVVKTEYIRYESPMIYILGSLQDFLNKKYIS